jgi:hypothetical protein
MAISATLSAAGSAHATTFTDSTFNYSDYSSNPFTQDYTSGTGTTLTSGQTANGGNPGAAYESVAHIGVNGSVLATAVNSSFVYNPGTTGAIGTINALLDRYAGGSIASAATRCVFWWCRTTNFMKQFPLFRATTAMSGIRSAQRE